MNQERGNLQFMRPETRDTIQYIWSTISKPENYTEFLRKYIEDPKSNFKTFFEKNKKTQASISYNRDYIKNITKLYNYMNTIIKFPTDRLTFQNICSYFGIMAECIQPRGGTLKSFYGKNLPRDNLFSYKYDLCSKFTSLWMYGSQTRETYILKIQKTKECMVVFNVGLRSETPMTKLDQIYNVDECIHTIDEIVKYSQKSKRLILCGHSNGMVSATVMSIILLCFMNNIFREYMISRNILSNEWWNYVSNKVKKIPKPQPILVYGSGGFPVIFTNEQDFIVYYHAIGSNYFHLAAAFTTKNNIYVDRYLEPYKEPESPQNWLFYIFGQSKSNVEKNLSSFLGLNKQTVLKWISSSKKEEWETLHNFRTYRTMITPLICSYSTPIRRNSADF
jgi:hypothetical protein